MPRALFLIGIPASGKSTFTSAFLEDKNEREWVVISSDAIIEEIAAKEGKTYSEAFVGAIKFASKEILVRAKDAFDSNLNIIWDQTNLNVKARASRVSMFPFYQKTAIVFPVPSNLEERLASRPGKNIPKDVIENMKKSFEYPTLSEGFTHIAEYTGNGPTIRYR